MDNKLNNISGFRLLNLIMRYGSLSLAAREMNISLSSASHILANMKQLLNDDLFFRTKNGLEPTQKMREIWPDISSAVNSIDRVFEPENTSLETVRRQFRLVVTDTGYVSFISPVTGLICRQAPGIEIEICQPGSDSEIVDGLRHGSFDFAINPNPPKAFDLIYHKLRELKYVLLVRAGHPLTKQNIGENFDIKKLLDFVQIIYSYNSEGFYRPWLDLKNMGMKTLVCPYFQASTTYLLSSDAVQWIPETAAQAINRNNEFRIITLPKKYTVCFTPKLFWSVKTDKDPVNQWLRSLIIDAAANLELSTK